MEGHMGKKIIVYIVNFFLTVSILALVCLLILSSTILNKQYMISKLNENNYYDRTNYDIQDTFRNYIMQSGLEESILDGLYDDNKLNNDINSVADAIYDDKDLDIETDTIRNTLNNRIDVALKDNHRVPDNSDKESIKEFVDTIVDVYAEGVAYSQDTVNKIGDTLAKVLSFVQKAKVVIIVAIIAIAIIIIVINNNIQESIRAFSSAVLSCGIIFILLKLLIGKRLHYILIFNNTFSDTLINISEAVVNTVLTTGIVMIIFGLVGIVIGSITMKVHTKGMKKGKH